MDPDLYDKKKLSIIILNDPVITDITKRLIYFINCCSYKCIINEKDRSIKRVFTQKEQNIIKAFNEQIKYRESQLKRVNTIQN